MKLYLLDWGNGMIGGFYGDSLEQAFNTCKELLAWSIKHCLELHKFKTVEIEFLESHQELNDLRKKRAMDPKPTF